MDTNEMIINTSNNVSFAVYGCLNIEEGNDYNTPLEVKESNETTYSPNISSSSFEPLSDFSELLVQTSYQGSYERSTMTMTPLTLLKST
ncbi:hypothetical protein MTR_1g053265 [Medicago truncatula]|uniref:Uncharacterized protein n=1 Tax=Medicago truncatula TaxID=3880 RepID=A0A072VHY7_MEDTR|nr:hypothetical protein MTR_1g053265 [Medicago truncatula]